MKKKSVEKEVPGIFKNNHSHFTHSAQRMHRLLTDHIQEIRNIDDWAKRAGCSTRWLRKCVNTHFIHKSPRILLREERYHKIRSIIEQNPNATALFVAGAAAPHWDARNLYNFLTSHYQTNFSDLRHEVLLGGGVLLMKRVCEFRYYVQYSEMVYNF